MSYRKASTFKDAAMEEQFRKDGYAVVKGFLSPEEIKYLKEIFVSVHQPVDKFMWNSLYDVPLGRRGEVSQKVLEVFKPKIEATFNDVKLPTATIMSKTPNRSDTFMAAHRDYTVLAEDEIEYRQVWCPLVDISRQNGAIFIIPGSHLVATRPLATLDICPYREFTEEQITKYGITMTPKAGDMVIYADRTLHGAFTNITPNERPVVHFGFYPHNTQLYYYFRNKTLTGNTIEVYEVPDDFYISADSIINHPNANMLLQRPEGLKLAKVIDYPEVHYTEADLARTFEPVMEMSS